jgi:hypothetical protein
MFPRCKSPGIFVARSRIYSLLQPFKLNRAFDDIGLLICPFLIAPSEAYLSVKPYSVVPTDLGCFARGINCSNLAPCRARPRPASHEADTSSPFSTLSPFSCVFVTFHSSRFSCCIMPYTNLMLISTGPKRWVFLTLSRVPIQTSARQKRRNSL